MDFNRPDFSCVRNAAIERAIDVMPQITGEQEPRGHQDNDKHADDDEEIPPEMVPFLPVPRHILTYPPIQVGQLNGRIGFTFRPFRAQWPPMERVIFRTACALALALTVFFAGCSTSNNATSVTMVSASDSGPIAKTNQPTSAPFTNAPISTLLTNVPVAKPVTNAFVAKPYSNAPVAKVTNAPVATPKPVAPNRGGFGERALPKEPEPIRGWFAIDRWVRTNGLGKLHIVSPGSQAKGEIIAPAGRLEFTVGSQFAKWNRLTFLLGYAPQIVAHEIAMNGLDIQKSILPLLQQRNVPLHGRVVVIDPGHGGDQRGTKSVVGNQFEKDYTLDWAKRLQTLLATNGWKVYLTRTNDIDVPLHERVAIADRVNADLFVSLHFNSGGSASAESGIETYCMTPYGMPANLTRNYGDDPFYNWPNNAFDRENFTWAMRLHRSMMSSTSAQDRGVRRARFMAVLRTQHRPAVLIEGGYLSNRHEATLISSPEYRQKLAQAVANAFPSISKQ
jgi:N-acetylmuramoyl-L-alanine amidase